MGILKTPTKFVQKLKLPLGFSVCELGDQWVTWTKPHYLAKELYQRMGCGSYVAIDANGRGDMTADLNLPLPDGLGQFDLVTDFGTGEHIFDQAQVWKTIHQLTKPGGFIVFDRPTQGYQTHGFYLVDECLLNDIAVSNDYEVRRLAHERTVRGELIRGVFKKPLDDKPFVVPYQGRYLKSRRIAC